MEEQHEPHATTPRRTGRETAQKEELKAFIASAQKSKKATPVKSEPRSQRLISDDQARLSRRIVQDGEGADGSPRKAMPESRSESIDLVEGKFLRVRKNVNYKEIPPEPMDMEKDVAPSGVVAEVTADAPAESKKPASRSRASGSASAGPSRPRAPAKPKSRASKVCDGTVPKRATGGQKARWDKYHAEKAAKAEAALAGENADSPSGDISSTTLVGDAVDATDGDKLQPPPSGISPNSSPPSTLLGHLVSTIPATQSSPSAKKRKTVDCDEGEAAFQAFKRSRPNCSSSQTSSTSESQLPSDPSQNACQPGDTGGPPQNQAKSGVLPGRTKSQQLAYEVDSYSASLGYQPRHPLFPSSTPVPAAAGSSSPRAAGNPPTIFDPPVPQSSSQPERISHTRATSDLGPQASRAYLATPPSSDPSQLFPNPMRQALANLPLPDPSALFSVPIASSSRPAPPAQPVWVAPYELLSHLVAQQQQSMADLTTFAAGWAETLQPSAAKWQEMLDERERMTSRIHTLEHDKECRIEFAQHQVEIEKELKARVAALEAEKIGLEKKAGEVAKLKTKLSRFDQMRIAAQEDRDAQRVRADKAELEVETGKKAFAGMAKYRDDALDERNAAVVERDKAFRERDELRAELEKSRI